MVEFHVLRSDSSDTEEKGQGAEVETAEIDHSKSLQATNHQNLRIGHPAVDPNPWLKAPRAPEP